MKPCIVLIPTTIAPTKIIRLFKLFSHKEKAFFKKGASNKSSIYTVTNHKLNLTNGKNDLIISSFDTNGFMAIATIVNITE